METLFTFVSPPDRCGYLPDQRWQLRYDVVGQLTPDEYMSRLKSGWRRFGFSLFRPECSDCKACRSLRVDVPRFCPDRSQKRAWARNAHDVRLTIGPPGVSDEKIRLYDRYHAYQSEAKGWPGHEPESPVDYIESFIDNPIPTEEWCYLIGDRLVGVGYVDHHSEGLSAIYFFYDPGERLRSLGTFNVLSVIGVAAGLQIPHVYLGFFVQGCRSLEYKARFRPNQLLQPDGTWRPFAK